MESEERGIEEMESKKNIGEVGRGLRDLGLIFNRDRDV